MAKEYIEWTPQDHRTFATSVIWKAQRPPIIVDKLYSHIVVARQNGIVSHSAAYLELLRCTLCHSCLCGICYNCTNYDSFVTHLSVTHLYVVCDWFIISFRLVCDLFAIHLSLHCNLSVTCLKLICDFIVTCLSLICDLSATFLWLICNFFMAHLQLVD